MGGHYIRGCLGRELWIDVLKLDLRTGLRPSLDGLPVPVGRGDLVTCSEKENSELFHGVLGGLGQFGIITRARIALEPAPKRVRWIRVLYSNFTAFTNDQKYLISLHDVHPSKSFDYVEGFVVVDEGLINNWRSSFFSPRNPVKISSIGTKGGVLYCLEMTKNYDESNADSLDQEVDALLKELDFLPATDFTTDLPYVDFLDRVHRAEVKLRAKGLWEVPHPWLNLFVPGSRILDFDRGVFRGILGNKTSGPILIYPVNKHKWDERSSVVTPNEEVFYLVAFLRTAVPDSVEPSQQLEYLSHQNQRILDFCNDAAIDIKQYLPNYSTLDDWRRHRGSCDEKRSSIPGASLALAREYSGLNHHLLCLIRPDSLGGLQIIDNFVVTF
ncbi:uncharacterized protein A4U43_C03F21070 [Asparagus officinalis]|uniref:cytokinin dehydrogenase n=1 Tax=Asparagus officinalis TaxID=4686 RepID=A0A5P1FBS6_ASPOF|nr:uncharacterized protein A4U43_C03F21070 [Asparagus officinalis]